MDDVDLSILRMLADAQWWKEIIANSRIDESILGERLRALKQAFGARDSVDLICKAVSLGHVKISDRLIQKWARNHVRMVGKELPNSHAGRDDNRTASSGSYRVLGCGDAGGSH